MRSALMFVTITAATLTLVASPASAAGRRRVGAPNKQAAVGAYGRAAYPRYYWGIPAREYQNAGTPHGDQGIRGDGIQWQPW